MRKRYRKVMMKNYSEYSRKEKRQFIKDEYLYKYFKKPKLISNLLYGKCYTNEGIGTTGWQPLKNDFIVRTPGKLSRKEIRVLNAIANKLKKELFVDFDWAPRGGAGEVIISILIEYAGTKILDYIFDLVKGKNKNIEAKKIEIIDNNPKRLEIKIIDKQNKQYYFEINKSANKIDDDSIKRSIAEFKNKKITTIQSDRLEYSYKGKIVDIEV